MYNNYEAAAFLKVGVAHKLSESIDTKARESTG